MRQEEEINELNSIAKTTIGVSKIHGVGVIAITDILAGTKIYADRMPKIYHISIGNLSKLFPDVRKMILERWPNVYHGEFFAYPDARLVSFMNHSYEENYDPMTDAAKKDIRAGEEITENYCIVKDAEKIYPWLDCSNYKNKL